MAKTIILAQVTDRMKNAVGVQAVLSEFGCNIKTRLGLHDVANNTCSGTGILILETCGKDKDVDAFYGKLKKIKGLRVKKVSF